MCRFLAYGDHDAAIAWFRYAIRGRYDQVELAAARNGDRVGLDTVADKSIAERCRAGQRQRLVGPRISQRIGMTNHLDLVDRAPLDIVEYRVVSGCRLWGQLIASEYEIKPEVLRQDRLRRKGSPKGDVDVCTAFLDRLTGAGPCFGGRIRLVERGHGLAVDDGKTVIAPTPPSSLGSTTNNACREGIDRLWHRSL